MSGSLHIHGSPFELAAAAADEVVARARAAVASRGRFSLVLAGGTTPLALYRRLAERAEDSTVPWAAFDWFWGDERPVPPEHPESNFGAAWEVLLSRLDLPPERVHRLQGELPPQEAASRYEAEIRRTFELGSHEPPHFDLVLLGLGTDGHTASLFPGCSALAERKALVAATWVEKLGHHRLTLTYPALNAAAQVLFLVAGADKAEVLGQVLHGPHEPERLPAQGIQPVTGELSFWVDRAAAGQTSRPPVR